MDSDGSSGRSHKIPNAVGGFVRCPKCGSTDIVFSGRTGMLVCQYCRYSWQRPAADRALGFDTYVNTVQGEVLARGAHQLKRDAPDVVTLKCPGCGAEVVVDSASALQARCHWCRSVLSLNARIANGAVPDAVLPFVISHEQAYERIRKFVYTTNVNYASEAFKRACTPGNVVGVFLPYLVIDVNARVELAGRGEVTLKSYASDDDSSPTSWDVDAYKVSRVFSISMDDLIVQSSRRRREGVTEAGRRPRAMEASNVIDAILPFDTKNAVAYDPNYLRGHTAERRDLDVDDVKDSIERTLAAAAAKRVRPTLRRYDRGVRWERCALDVTGARALTVYAPVWLYSYYERRGGKGFMHYVALNGRTGSLQGTVPSSRGKKFLNWLLAVATTFGISAAFLFAIYMFVNMWGR